MKNLLFLLILSLIPLLDAIHPNDAKDVDYSFRIKELFSKIGYPIEPAVPSNFVAMSFDGEDDFHDFVYWGPKETLKSFFKNQNSLKQPIIRVTISDSMGLSSSSFLDGENGEELKFIKQCYPKGFFYEEKKWGTYPVLETRFIDNGHELILAYAGFDTPGVGITLTFHLVKPEKQKKYTKEQLALWKNFIDNTKQLAGIDLLRFTGKNLQEGYSIVDCFGEKIKITGEKRKRDGKLQIVVISTIPNLHYSFISMEEGKLDPQWKEERPIIKAHANITFPPSVYIQEATSILIDHVEEFSVNPNEINPTSIIGIYQN